MKPWTRILVSAAFAALAATAAPGALAQDAPTSDEAKQAERDARLKLASTGLEKLYRLQPEAKAAVEGGVGYAVFEVDSIYAVLFVGQKGKGVLVDNASKKPTYMLLSLIHI